ncbi:unnamed protein product [Prunus armeniaca]
MEEEEGLKENVEAEEVEKEVIEELSQHVTTPAPIVASVKSENEQKLTEEWEASKENPGKFITTLKDPTGASVPKEKEATIQVTKLPLCNNKSNEYLASLRPLKGMQSPSQLPLIPLPLKSLENRLH